MATGKKNSTLVRSNPAESKLLATGVKSLKFWHEASEGDKSIPFGSLNMPSDISSLGYSNPSSTDILSANLGFFKENVEVHSYLNGQLLEGTFVVKNSQITLLNYEAVEGEIFRVKFDNKAVTGNFIVDARPLTATGVLTAGQTEFNVGEAFKINQYTSSQIGEVLVFVDGAIQFRNVGNATAAPAADGNYQEIHSSGGFGTSIKFNEAFAQDVNIVVVSRGLISERPNVSMMQYIENLGGQLDKVIEVVAQDAGLDPSEFQAAPNNIDLKAFGDKVFENRQLIDGLESSKQDKFEILWQRKSGDSGGVSGVMVQYNNLEVGKTYKLSGTYFVDGNSGRQQGFLGVRNGGVPLPLESSIGMIFEGGLDQRGTTGFYYIFEATDSELTIEEESASNLNNSVVNTYLEELPNHVETNKWT